MASLNNKTPYDIVHRLRFPDGRIKFVHEQGETLYDSKGNAVSTLGTVHDITRQKEAEMLLQKNEKKYAQVVENISDGIMIRDKSGKITYANNCFLKMFCLDETDIIDLNFMDLVAEEHKNHMADKHIRRFSVEHIPENFEFLGIRKDGQKRCIDIRVTRNIENGIVESVQAIVRDITDKKDSEKKIGEKNRELIKINSELDRFVYSTSHDLRAPLLSLLGLIDLLKDSEDRKEFEQYIEMMTSSIVRMDNTIKDILVYSRNSRMELNFEQLNIRDITNNHIDSIIHMSSAKNISFILNFDNKVPFYSDRLRVGAIINNLVSNAVKYQRVEEENQHVKVTFNADNEEGILVVEDNGEGISATNQKKVFEMFYRLSEKSDGSGLGLYICNEIIDKMGGSIEIISEKGKGCTFIVRLPNHSIQ